MITACRGNATNGGHLWADTKRNHIMGVGLPAIHISTWVFVVTWVWGSWTIGNDQPALRARFACESGLSEPEIGPEHAFVLLIWQKKHDKWQNSHVACLQKQLQTALILSVSFIWSHPWVGINGLWLSLSSVSDVGVRGTVTALPANDWNYLHANLSQKVLHVV
jgi:hypothetical protein